MRVPVLFFLFAGLFFLTGNKLYSQGYVSPYKYENGNFRLKTPAERARDEYRPAQNTYKPAQKNSSSSKSNDYEEPHLSESEKAYQRKIWAQKRKEDSIKKANKMLDDYREFFAWAQYSDYYKLDAVLRDMMYKMDYKGVDSVTLGNLNYFSGEVRYMYEWKNYYRVRLCNRLLSQLFLGRLDSAWHAMNRIERADKFADSALSAWPNPKDIPLIRAFLLYEGGVYDSASYASQKAIDAVSDKGLAFKLYTAYCIKSRCALARGNAKEAKRIIDDYMYGLDSKNAVVIKKKSGIPKPYICETYGLIYQKLGKLDSALFYFRGAVKVEAGYERTALHGYARNYDLPICSIGDFEPPAREAFLQAALLGGYQLDNPDNEGYKLLVMADNLGVPKAGYILQNNIPWKQPLKPAVKTVSTQKSPPTTTKVTK